MLIAEIVRTDQLMCRRSLSTTKAMPPKGAKSFEVKVGVGTRIFGSWNLAMAVSFRAGVNPSAASHFISSEH